VIANCEIFGESKLFVLENMIYHKIRKNMDFVMLFLKSRSLLIDCWQTVFPP
jgi:hypothetical protein